MEDAPKGKEDFFEFKVSLAVVKHEILKRYLNAWLPILYRYNNPMDNYDQLLYVDGFAGPGKYADGSAGSPIAALEIALCNTGLKLREGGPKIKLVFIELKESYVENLQSELKNTRDRCVGDGSAVNDALVEYVVLQGTFKDQMENVFANNVITKGSPILVFADPFGYSGDLIPMELMRKIFTISDRAELFINLMDGFANRQFRMDARATAINKLLGIEDATIWRNIVFEAGPESDKSKKAAAARREAFVNLYISQLFNGDAAHHLKFGMKNKYNRHIYHLVFFTHHPKGIMEMKRAMAIQSQDNDNFVFSEFSRDKGYSQNKDEIWTSVKELIIENFKNQSCVTGKMIIDFVWIHTIYVWKFAVLAKKEFKEIVMKPDSKIENIVFNFKNYLASSNDPEPQVAGCSSPSAKKQKNK